MSRQLQRAGEGRRVFWIARDPGENLMPATIAAVKAHASMGEIVNALREVFGTYVETPVF